MARPTDNGVPANPDIKFEHSDADAAAIVKGGAYLGATLALAAILTTVLGVYLSKHLGEVKKTDLEAAKVEYELPPEPRLEALDDLRERDKRNVQIFPPRAADYYEPQVKELKGMQPIDKAVAAEKGLFPVRKDGGKGPTNYGVELPSRGAAGLKTTGGQ